MKNIHWAAVPLAAILCATGATAVTATPATQEIVVSASPRSVALADWSKRVQGDLERNMRPSNRLGAAFDEGLVTIGFRCNEAGRPEGVTVVRSSGNQALDRLALRAVRRITTLHPMVDGMRPQQKVAAQMLYLNGYDTKRTVASRMKQLNAAAQSGNGWFTREEIASGEVLVLGAAH